MVVAKQSTSFVFIDQSDDATAKVTGAKRKAIRKQAMRDIGLARREKGGYGRINKRQLPLFIGSMHDLNEVQMDVELDAEHDQKQSLVTRPNQSRKVQEQRRILDAVWRVCPPLPQHGYEKVRMELGFDLMTLSPFTTVHFSRAVATALVSDPSSLGQLMRMPVPSSFLDRGKYRDTCSSTRRGNLKANRIRRVPTHVITNCVLSPPHLHFKFHPFSV